MPATGKFRTWQGSGASLRWKLPTIKAATMTVPASMLPVLASESAVVYMSLDRQMTMTSNPATEEFATAVEADVAASQYALDGTGIGVAVIDSGVARS